MFELSLILLRIVDTFYKTNTLNSLPIALFIVLALIFCEYVMRQM